MDSRRITPYLTPYLLIIIFFNLRGEQNLNNVTKLSPLPAVMTLGGAVCDIFMEYPSPELMINKSEGADGAFVLFPEGGKVEINTVHYAVGGGGANVAYGLAKFGLPTTIFFKSGNDHTADFIKTDLLLHNIDVRYTVTDEATPTGTSFILPSPSKDRTVLVYRGANALVKETELPCPYFKNFKGIYIAPISGSLAQYLPLITKRAREASCLVMHNPSRHQLTACFSQLLTSLASIDILMVNRAEAELFYSSLGHTKSSFTRELFFKELHHLGATLIVLTDGSNGAFCSTKNSCFHQVCCPTKVTNTVGAGDAFGAAFFGALLTSKSIKDALLFGALNSASTLACAKPHGGLLSKEELETQAAILIEKEHTTCLSATQESPHETILYS